MTTKTIIEKEKQYVVQTYARPEVVFDRGEGAYVYDLEGRRYLDFTSGICVTSLGHSDERWAKTVCEQASKLAHVSNLYHTAPHAELAEMLVESSFGDKVYFCNSGTEANEAAIKFARKWARTHHGQDKHKLLAFESGFHGRTMGSLALTHNPKYRDPFAPVMPGVSFAPYNDLAAAEEAMTDEHCAVFVEPLQGEGGVHPATREFLSGLRTVCDRHDALLVFDEVQCGLGRTGHLWAYEAYGVEPDIMSLAKPLAGGLPIGASVVRDEVADVLGPGDHGSTFAAGPLVCAAARVVLERIGSPELLRHVRECGDHLRGRLEEIGTSKIKDVRGAGLLVGVELDGPVDDVISRCRQQGLLIIKAGAETLRLAPPLTVEMSEIDEAVGVLSKVISEPTS
jgi:predicted acetylornithine/succinylornithine family transaminase